MVNYSKAIIYKICCKDSSITDIYIGSTTNKNRRNQEHKSNCNNENVKAYNYYVYQFIRANGGFDNWQIVVVENYSCQNRTELETRERYWLDELKATLNKVIPTRTKQEYHKDHKEEIEEYRKQYYKEYNQKNKEYRKQKHKEYSQKHKEEISKNNKQKKICECGAEVSKGGLSKHRKSQKHLKYLEELNL